MPNSISTSKNTNSIVFIDSTVPDYQSLAASVVPGIEVIILYPQIDEIEQITDSLSLRNNINALHIVSHGSPGSLQFGNAQLNSQNLHIYENQLQQWRNSFSDNADILLYGCHVAAGENGVAFIQQLSELTGADIAASDDLTGSAALDGDWDLEVNSGLIEAPLPLAFQVGVIAYSAVLGTLRVNSTADNTTSGDGLVTLREAIIAANNDTTTDLGETGSGADTIVLSAGNTYNLDAALTAENDFNWGNTGLPVITSNITINGNGAKITGDNNDFRIFRVNTGGNLTLNDLTLTNARVQAGGYGGDAGALLNTNGSVTISNSTFTNNQARDDGGAILNFQGTITIENSTFSNNIASGAPNPNGGAIENDGGNVAGSTFLTLINSTVSGNTADGDGGGIRNRNQANLTLTNSTIAFNTSTASGGGIFNSANATVQNSIVIGNTATNGLDVSGTFTSNNANIIGDTTDSTGFGSDITGFAAASVLNPTLANNGGSTQTHALIAGSVAIDAANNADAPIIDQRGGERVGGVNSGTKADIGAYEATSSYVVTNTNDDNGIGSLRSAINFANINVNPVTANPQDTIRFNIGSGAQTIAPTSALPTITQSIIIDGTTQPGFTTTPIIELDGTNAGVSTNGLTITAGNSTVRGLVINRFTQSGILLQTNGNNIIEGNYIGTDVNGAIDLGNAIDGIRIDNIANNTIGGTTAAQRNIISGNNNSGIYVIGNTATGNQILGNYIGTNATGTASIGNSFFGGVIVSAPNNIIGGTATGAGNLISGNAGRGITIGTSIATGNQILGNLIGTDVNGTSILGNSGDGVNTIASNTIIGGTTAAARNIISGNNNGVVISADNNQVKGNYIGTDITGNVDLGNTFSGVSIISANNTIGGTVAGARNIISGNNSSGVNISTNSATGNQVLGNYIGTKADGTSALGNGSHGIAIFTNAANNAIGSTTAGNTIAFSGADGVSIQSSAGTGNSILGNSIFSNTGLGIDLGNDGVQANDTGDADTGANNLQNYPVLTGATSDGTSTSVAGTFNGAASTNFTLQFFSNATSDPTGYGEGQTFLGSTTVTTDASGNASFTPNFATAVAAGQYITATATDPSNNTSEFSIAVPVTAPIAPGAVLINEVVTEPQQDWSAGNFTNPNPGGTAGTNDEWVELYITKDGLNLTGATIELSDSSPVTGTLVAGGAFQISNYIGSGGGSFTNTKAGDYLVLGNVASSGQMNNSIAIVLKDAGGAVIDKAQFSGGATKIGDEAAARVPNGTDTDDDATDFRKQAATLGTSNNIPEIQVLETATDIPDNTGSLNFGTTPLGTAITKTFTIKNTGFSDLTLNSISPIGIGFSLASPFGSTTIAPGNSTTFQVKLDANNAGNYNGTISFGNNDKDENPYNFNITGTVQPATVEITPGTNPTEEGVTNGTFNIKLSSPAPTGGLTVNYNLSGSALFNTDYTISLGSNIIGLSPTQFVIAAGKDTGTINIVPFNDSIVEPGETVNVTLNAGSDYIVSSTNNQATLTIVDNDSTVGFSQNNYQVNENGTIVGTAITINRTGNTSFASSVQVGFSSKNAIGNGVDYDSTTQTINFAAGETTKTVFVPINEDNLIEGNEVFGVSLINPSPNVAIDSSKQFADVEIIDNDSSIKFSDTNYQVNEDGTVVGSSITLLRTGVTTGTASVDVKLTTGTATGGTDFNNTTQTITFAANETSKTVIVPIIEDNLIEGNENLSLTLTNPGVNTSIVIQDDVTLEILDNDSSIQFSQANYQVNEDGSVVGVAVTLNRTGVTTGTSSIDVQLTNGTATGGVDFNNTTQTINFAANETSKTVIVPITEDNLVEGNENLTLTLANASANTAIGTQNTATLEIIDNDSSIQFSQANYQVNEDGSVVGVAVTLNRTGVTTSTASVDIQLINGTATGGVDFNNTTQTINFAANETSKTVVVPITEDSLFEGNENLTLTLANASTNTNIGTQNTATLTIIDNDTPPTVAFSQANYQVNENGAVIGVAVTINRTGDTSGVSNIDIQLTNGTATGGIDFTATTQTINFAANETSQTVIVPITEDNLVEGNENLTLTLANASANTNIGTQNTATLEIIDNDSSIQFSQTNYQVNEDGSVVGVAITLNRTGVTTGTSSVDIQLTNGSATGGVDFNNTTQTINFAANETSKTVVVPITEDSLFEGNENLTLTLANASTNTNIGTQSTATLTIIDNDTPPTVAFSQANYQVNENGAVIGVAVTINRTGDTSGVSNIDIQLTNGTATGGIDFTATTQTINFAANETSKTVVVPITEDNLVEGNENLTLTLANASANTNIGTQNTATLEIIDNDSSIQFSQTNYQVNEDGSVVGVAVTLNRTGVTTGTSSIDVQLTNGTATGGVDFNNTTQTINFAANETSKTVVVPITEDNLVEGNENLTLTLANASANTNIGTQSTATLAIVDNDNPPINPPSNPPINPPSNPPINPPSNPSSNPPNNNPSLPINNNLPVVYISDATAIESNSGDNLANFSLTLSAASGQNVIVEYATADGTATTTDNDYDRILPQTITFSPGEISKTISVAVKGDTKVEENESFFVNLIGVANAIIADNQGVGIIVNDDIDNQPEDNCFCEQLVHPNLDTFFAEGKEGYSLAQLNQVSNSIFGTESDDNLIGSDINDGIDGFDGDDFLLGNGGSDNLHGHNGKDTIFGDRDRDWIVGNEGDDLLNGNEGNDVINGNQGEDIARGGKGHDIVRGGQDNDRIWGDSGDDTLIGDKGNDSIFGGTSDREIGDANGRDLILGSSGDDFLNGNQGNDTVCGNEGNDTIRGGKDDDIAFGDAGNDAIFGDLGNDSLCGGDGNDTIYAGNGSDVPIGNVGEKDCLCGGNGNDLLFGNEGEDKINGDAGEDSLYGGKDHDTLSGGEGNDWLSGDLGDDILRGGNGSDRFILSPGFGTDIILDFQDNTDYLVLAGNLSFARLIINQSSEGTAIAAIDTGEVLAILKGVSPNLITQQDFILQQIPVA